MNDFERQYILTELRKHHFNKEAATQVLKISLRLVAIPPEWLPVRELPRCTSGKAQRVNPGTSP